MPDYLPPDEAKLLRTIADQLAEMHEAWPKFSALVFRHDRDIRILKDRSEDHSTRLHSLEITGKTGMAEEYALAARVWEMGDESPTGSHRVMSIETAKRLVKEVSDERDRDKDAGMWRTIKGIVSTDAKIVVAVTVTFCTTGFLAYVGHLLAAHWK